MNSTPVSLSEMIHTLRDELSLALHVGAAQSVRFSVTNVDLELSVTVRRDLSTGGKISFWVVTADASAAQETAATHRFQISLTPKLDGVPLDVASETNEGPRP